MVVIRNILWDVDGTLFDTYPAITYAISKTLNEMGLSVALNMIDGLARQSLSHCIGTLSQRFKLDPNLLNRQFAEFYRTISPARQPPFPGVNEVCEFIHQNGGMNIAITHRGLESTQQLLAAHELVSFFMDTFTTEQGNPSKPDPGMVETAIERYDLQPVETLLIGDREVDIQDGQAAGVRTFLFGKATTSAIPEMSITHYGELLQQLKFKSEGRK